MLRKFIYASLLILLPIRVYAQTIDEIIKKNIDAHGGLARMKEITSIRMTGKMTFPTGTEAAIVYMKKRPGLLRVEMSMQGMTGIQAYDGETAWYISPFANGNKDPQKMSEEEAQDILEQADFDGPLVDYEEKGNTVELIQKEDWESGDVYKLKITSKSGHFRYLYLDLKTGLETRARNIMKREGLDQTMDSFFGDFRNVEGMIYAFLIQTKNGIDPGPKYTIEKIEQNVELPDSLFKMPVASDSPAKE